jgi:hypothetical protein
MPTNRTKTNPTKPWHARVKKSGIVYSLGYYKTEQEAKDVENDFRMAVDVKPQVPNAIQYERIKNLRDKGLTTREIATQLNLAYSTIRSVTSVYERRNANAN